MKVEPNDPLQRMIVCFQLSRMAAAGRVQPVTHEQMKDLTLCVS